MRVVFDSNVYVSALTLPGGVADSALTAVLAGRATLLLSEPMLGEVLGVLGRKFARDKEQLARTALFLTELAEPVECAVAGRADLVVTGDRAMLRLGRYEGVEIITLRAFLARLESRH